jgi:DNA repair protein REV1 C-terminal domain
MKVVKPEWLVESARLGTLLPWQEFKFQQSHRIDHGQGSKIPQKTVIMLPSPSRASRQPALAEDSMSSTVEIDESLEQDLQFPSTHPELPSLPNLPNSPIPATKPRYARHRSVDSNSNSNHTLSSTIHFPHGLNDGGAGPSTIMPSKKTAELMLPSFSQIDMNVFNVLPEDVRQELEAEYKRRSVSPLPPMFSAPSVKPASKITVKGTKIKPIPRKPTSSRSVTKSPTKLQASAMQATQPSVHVSEAELRKLNIDPEIFIELPVDVQQEQLALARQAKFAGVPPIKLVQRIVIKPLKPRPSAAIYRHPPPQAKYPPPPFIKQWDKDMKEKLHFTEVEDVQRVIEAWVEAFNDCLPNDRDVKNLAKFLVQSVDGSKSTDVGLENAVRVMKWWMVLLRKHWGQWENVDGDRNEDRSSTGNVTSEVVGKAWWKAFRGVKDQMDLTACKKFGGRISLK